MRVRVSVPEEHVHPNVVDALLEGVTRLDEHMIRSGQSPTSHEAIAAGAIWRPEHYSEEHFDHGNTIATRGWGDCDDWAPLHAATLRASGEDVGAVARVVPSGPSTYHAIVQRSDGSIDDPSIAAGMKPTRTGHVGGADGESIEIIACDPHDPSHVYQGSLAPTVGPLSLHCGPTFAVRNAGVQGLYEGRCDVPLDGSPLVHVKSYTRRAPKHHRHHRGRHHTHGAVPYAASITTHAPTPVHALANAIAGAVMLGDAAELHSTDDRAKLLALQGLICGMHPHDAAHALCMHGCSPEQADHAVRSVVGMAQRCGARRTSVVGEAHAFHVRV